jgi:hypothetical protein
MSATTRTSVVETTVDSPSVKDCAQLCISAWCRKWLHVRTVNDMYSGTSGYRAVARADSNNAAMSDRACVTVLPRPRRRCDGLEMNTASMIERAEQDTDMRRYHASSTLERPSALAWRSISAPITAGAVRFPRTKPCPAFCR